MGCNCGSKSSKPTKIEVKTPKGTYQVGSVAEAKIRVALDGGGTYRNAS